VDSNTAPTFEGELKSIIDEGQRNVVLELGGVEFMSSAGLRAMVSALKACRGGGGNLVIASPSDRVVEVMQLAGLTSLFNMYDDETAAVGSF
jgi:anti-sigma B factor antagonist